MHRTPANRIKVNFAVNQKLLAKSQSPTTNRAATTKRHRQMFAHSYSYSPKNTDAMQPLYTHTHTYSLALTSNRDLQAVSRFTEIGLFASCHQKKQIKKKMSIIKFTFFHSRFQLAAQMKK